MEEEEEEDINIDVNSNIIDRIINLIYVPLVDNNNNNYVEDYSIMSVMQDAYLLNQSFINDKKKYKTVLAVENEENIDEIFKIIKYEKGEDNNNDKCPIMSTPFENGQEVIQLPCHHYFEPEAIKQWLIEEKAECPVCRYNNFKTKEIKIEEEENEEIHQAQQQRRHTIQDQLDIYTEAFIRNEEESINYNYFLYYDVN